MSSLRRPASLASPSAVSQLTTSSSSSSSVCQSRTEKKAQKPRRGHRLVAQQEQEKQQQDLHRHRQWIRPHSVLIRCSQGPIPQNRHHLRSAHESSTVALDARPSHLCSLSPPLLHPTSLRPSSSSSNNNNNNNKSRTKRSYATVAAHDSSSDSLLHWPTPADPRRLPTPYDIFNQSRSEPYSKRRFYDLVKLYHPDRAPHPSHAADPHVRLDRYRLVVAANAILSDPSRRSAYDSAGAGWPAFRSDISTDEHGAPAGATYTTLHRWRAHVRDRYAFSTDDDPMYNATWEDWERWYHRQQHPHLYHNRSFSSFFSSRRPQGTVFTSNAVFLALVAMLAALGGLGQATRASAHADGLRERAARRSDEVGRVLASVRDETRAQAAADDDDEEDARSARIRRWVRGRDDYSEGEVDGRVARAGDADLCAPGLTADRSEVPFWKRPPER